MREGPKGPSLAFLDLSNRLHRDGGARGSSVRPGDQPQPRPPGGSSGTGRPPRTLVLIFIVVLLCEDCECERENYYADSADRARRSAAAATRRNAVTGIEDGAAAANVGLDLHGRSFELEIRGVRISRSHGRPAADRHPDQR